MTLTRKGAVRGWFGGACSDATNRPQPGRYCSRGASGTSLSPARSSTVDADRGAAVQVDGVGNDFRPLDGDPAQGLLAGLRSGQRAPHVPTGVCRRRAGPTAGSGRSLPNASSGPPAPRLVLEAMRRRSPTRPARPDGTRKLHRRRSPTALGIAGPCVPHPRPLPVAGRPSPSRSCGCVAKLHTGSPSPIATASCGGDGSGFPGRSKGDGIHGFALPLGGHGVTQGLVHGDPQPPPRSAGRNGLQAGNPHASRGPRRPPARTPGPGSRPAPKAVAATSGVAGSLRREAETTGTRSGSRWGNKRSRGEASTPISCSRPVVDLKRNRACSMAPPGRILNHISCSASTDAAPALAAGSDGHWSTSWSAGPSEISCSPVASVVALPRAVRHSTPRIRPAIAGEDARQARAESGLRTATAPSRSSTCGRNASSKSASPGSGTSTTSIRPSDSQATDAGRPSSRARLGNRYT